MFTPDLAAAAASPAAPRRQAGAAQAGARVPGFAAFLERAETGASSVGSTGLPPDAATVELTGLPSGAPPGEPAVGIANPAAETVNPEALLDAAPPAPPPAPALPVALPPKVPATPLAEAADADVDARAEATAPPDAPDPSLPHGTPLPPQPGTAASTAAAAPFVAPQPGGTAPRPEAERDPEAEAERSAAAAKEPHPAQAAGAAPASPSPTGSAPALAFGLEAAGPGWRLAAGSVADARAPELARPPATVAPRDVAGQITLAVAQATQPQVEIRLDPPELGRVQIRLTPSEGGLVAVVLAERPETQDFLRRHAETLARDLTEAGYAKVSLEFAAGGEAPERREAPEERRFALPPDASLAAAGAAPPAPPPRRGVGGLDIRL